MSGDYVELGGQPPGMNQEIGPICVVAVAVDTAVIKRPGGSDGARSG
jgi:hypothetical protein